MGETPNSIEAAASDIPHDFSAPKALAAWMHEIAPYGVFTTDTSLRIRSWNHWLVTRSGLSELQVLGRRLSELFPDLEARHLLPRFDRALAGEVSVLSAALHKYLFPLPCPVPESGLPYMLQTVRIAPLPAEGHAAGTITLIEDVTQREFHATSLSRQQELERLLSTSLAILLQADGPAQEMGGIFASIIPVLGVDVYACYLLSDSRDTLALKDSAGILPSTRKNIAELPIDEREQRLLDVWNAASEVEIASHRAALGQLGVAAHLTFPLAVNNRFLGLVSFASYEKTRIASVDGQILGRIARYVAIALDRAARERDISAASKAKDDFLAALSHELRTPLNPVLLMASDSATNPAFSDDARDSFKVIEKNVLLEARLIDDLLDLTRIERGKLHMEFRPVDVHSLVHDALVTMRAETSQKKIHVETTFQADPSVVAGDSGRLQQVFWNVLRNAAKFTPESGKISVVTRTGPTGEVAVEVTDTGIGMEKHELNRIFGAFSQGDHAGHGSHRFGGLGLGLAISKRLVELHLGRIEARSPGKNQGATFTIYLPLRGSTGPSSNAEDARPKGAPPPSPKRDPAGPIGRILLVEDHDATRVTLSRLLSRRGYAVEVADSSAAAKMHASKAPFDLVLSDVGLPDGDGYGLMRYLKEHHRLTGIALTGYGMEADVARGRDAGFISHLTKPISIQALETAVTSALSEREPAPPKSPRAALDGY